MAGYGRYQCRLQLADDVAAMHKRRKDRQVFPSRIELSVSLRYENYLQAYAASYLDHRSKSGFSKKLKSGSTEMAINASVGSHVVRLQYNDQHLNGQHRPNGDEHCGGRGQLVI